MQKPFRKDFPHAASGITKEFAHVQDQPNALSRTGQVFHDPTIAAMQASRWLLAQRAQRARRGLGHVEHELILVPLYLGQFQSLAQWEELRCLHPDMVLLLSRL
jgi:hypothetical protein